MCIAEIIIIKKNRRDVTGGIFVFAHSTSTTTKPGFTLKKEHTTGGRIERKIKLNIGAVDMRRNAI